MIEAVGLFIVVLFIAEQLKNKFPGHLYIILTSACLLVALIGYGIAQDDVYKQVFMVVGEISGLALICVLMLKTSEFALNVAKNLNRIRYRY